MYIANMNMQHCCAICILLESLNVSGAGEGEEMEDGDDDVEYNYLADQEEVEKEEFRNDRAVKISS